MKNQIPLRDHIYAAVTMTALFLLSAGAEGLADLITGVIA